MLLAVWKNARWNPRETGTGEKSLARRVQREDFRQETGNDSVNRGILGRGCCSSLKRNFTFRAILRSFEFYCLSFKAPMNQNFYTFFFFTWFDIDLQPRYQKIVSSISYEKKRNYIVRASNPFVP